MKLNLAHNWIAKVLSLLLAIAIWFLISDHLESTPPKAKIVEEPVGSRKSPAPLPP